MKTLEITVQGRVQGVGFRYSCLHHARQLNLTGYAKNKPDGSVEILLQGSEEQVAAFQKRMHEKHTFPGVILKLHSTERPVGNYSIFSIY